MSAALPSPARPAPLWREPQDAATFAPCTQRQRVLVVEDDPVQALLLTLMLGHLDVDVTLVHDGAQAVDAVQTGHYPLVLMDYRMPRLDGVEATRIIRAWEQAHHRRATAIVAVTASAMHSECAACLAAGMDDVVLKPFSARALADVLARHGAARQQGVLVHGAVS